VTDPLAVGALQPGDPPGEPVAGNIVQVDAVVPSAEANKAQGRLNIARTVTQTGSPGALLVIFTWAFALAHIDLDPGPGTDLPAVVGGAFVVVGTGLAAYLMNRGRLRGEG
jgi:hypothetical protein